MIFIDRNYYTNNYKARVDERIQGAFQNVDINNANFEHFQEKASDLIDRVLDNLISKLGGIDYISETPRAWIKKATATAIGYWFRKGYDTKTIDEQLSNASISAMKKADIKAFRDILPLDTLLLIQKSNLWKNKAVGVNIQKALNNCGIDPQDILLTQDAIDLFKPKDEYDNSFHIRVDVSDVVTGDPNITRYIKVAESSKTSLSFEIFGGENEDIGRSTIFINRIDVSNNQQYVYTIDPTFSQAQNTFYKFEDDGNVSIYLEINDAIERKILLITNILPDDLGDYGFLGSQDTDDDLIAIPKANVLENAELGDLEQKIDDLTNLINQLDIPQMKIDLDQVIATANNNRNLIDNNGASISTLNTTLAQVIADLNQTNANLQTTINRVTNIETRLDNFGDSYLNKDGTTELPANYIPTSQRQVANKEYVDINIQDLDTKINNTITGLTDGFKRLWTGSITGSATDDNDNVTTIQIPNATQPQNEPFALNDTIEIWLNVNVTGVGVITLSANIRVGQTTPQKIMPVRDSNGGNLEGMYGVIDNNGLVTITRNSGNDAQFTTIALVEAKEISGITFQGQQIEIDDTEIVAMESENIADISQVVIMKEGK